MQGPLGINWSAPDHPRPENASLTTLNWGRPDRIRKWLDCQVHLKGRPEWLFVKLHSHGAIEHDFDALFGEKAYLMHRHLNNHYNDGKHFKLHYVTARQAYNIAKAAEADMEGDPTDWIDFRVSPPATSLYTANSPHTLVHCTAERLTLREIRSQPETKMQCRVGPIRAISGAFTELDIDVSAMELRLRGGANGAATEIEIESQRQFTAVPNMLYCGLSDTGRGHRSKIILTGETVLKFQ